jgi:uncharacterized protein YkwD
MLAVAATSSGCVAPVDDEEEETAATSQNLSAELDAEESKFLDLINDYRAKKKKKKLVATSALNKKAHAHSTDMAKRDYFDHDGPGGKTFEKRIKGAKCPCGENIGAGEAKAKGNFQMWKESPEHNANMLDKDFTAIGIARARDDSSEFGWYWTTVFGKK